MSRDRNCVVTGWRDRRDPVCAADFFKFSVTIEIVHVRPEKIPIF